jgi:hypothetical protein
MEDRKNIEKTKRRGVERALVRWLGWPKKYDYDKKFFRPFLLIVSLEMMA